MEEVLRRENLFAALKRVQANKGAPGVDGMTVEDLPDYLRKAWPDIREQLLSGCSAQQAVRHACHHIAEGNRWVVDLDLEKFFDRVNHDLLMSRVARKIKDKRLLKLIRRYLTAGIMEDGLVRRS